MEGEYRQQRQDERCSATEAVAGEADHDAVDHRARVPRDVRHQHDIDDHSAHHGRYASIQIHVHARNRAHGRPRRVLQCAPGDVGRQRDEQRRSRERQPVNSPEAEHRRCADDDAAGLGQVDWKDVRGGQIERPAEEGCGYRVPAEQDPGEHHVDRDGTAPAKHVAHDHVGRQPGSRADDCRRYRHDGENEAA